MENLAGHTTFVTIVIIIVIFIDLSLCSDIYFG